MVSKQNPYKKEESPDWILGSRFVSVRVTDRPGTDADQPFTLWEEIAICVPPVKYIVSDRKDKCDGESLLPKDVADFVKVNNLASVLEEALCELRKACGEDCNPSPWVFQDPDTGNRQLIVEIKADDPREADGGLMDFCYDWWFDRVGDLGHLLGFRVTAS